MTKPSAGRLPPKKQLDSFLVKYLPEVRATAKAALVKMRRRLPGAIEMVYDNYNFLVIGFSPTERPSEAVFSLALAPRYVLLCFLHGAKLPDPQKLLRGGGKQVRNIILQDADDLDKPAVRALTYEAVNRAAKPFEKKARGRTI